MVEMAVLKTIPLFRQLSPRQRARVAACAQVEHFRKGDALFRQGQQVSAVWLVLKGWVHLVRHPEEHANGGSGAVIFTITPEDALCGISGLDGEAYHVSGIAATDCTALRVAAPVLREVLVQEPQTALLALQVCIRRLQHIAQQYGAMAEPVSHRIIRTMLRMQRQFGKRLPLTHRELAQMAWTTTESAIRVVRQLKQRGWVSGTRGEMVVEDAPALRAALAGNGHAAGV